MFCSQCGRAIDADSLYCRFCGAKQQTDDVGASPGASPNDGSGQTDPSGDGAEMGSPGWSADAKLMLGVAGAIILFVLLALVLVPKHVVEVPDDANTISVDNMTAIDDQDLFNGTGAVPTSAPIWTYSTDEDKVRGGTSYFARTTSTNSVDLAAPYDGGSTISLTVRKSPAYGTDVIFRLSSGQLMCPSYEGCYGTVRFDNGPAQRVSLTGPSDGSSDTVFASDGDAFLAKLRRAKRMVLEIEIYQAGRPQFEFDVAGLKWDHSPPAAVPMDDVPDDNSSAED